MSDEACSRCETARATGALLCPRCKRVLASTLANARLAGLDLRGADLTGVDLSGADLSGADLRGVKLDHAIVSGANLHDARIDHIYADYLSSVRLRGYVGTPVWRPAYEAIEPIDRPRRYEVSGYAVRCPLCAGEDFFLAAPVLATRAQPALGLDGLDAGTSTLTCAACSRIECFRRTPLPRPDPTPFR